MIGYLKLDEVTLGEVDLKIMDETMGVIGGTLIPYPEYFKHQNHFQAICEKKGIVNGEDCTFSIAVPNVIKINNGIGITDVIGFAQVEVEAVGLTFNVLNKMF